MQVGPNSILRGVGAGVACLLPGAGTRGLALAGSYAAAGLIDPTGIKIVAIEADESGRQVVPLATATASWMAVQSVAIGGLRRLPLPSYVVALVWGVAVVAVDVAVGHAELNPPVPEEPQSAMP
jgi:hypothetical protein